MNFKIIISDDITNSSELKQRIEKGAKFISFEYCITILFAVTLRRFSPAILIENEDDMIFYKSKYNRLTNIYGWWGFPYGILRSKHALAINKAGGIDMTDDIMLNITEDSFTNKEVDLIRTNQLFCKPHKTDIKAFRKSLNDFSMKNRKVTKIIVGKFINTSENQTFIYYVGIKSENKMEENIEEIKKLFYKQFRKYVTFHFLDLNQPDDTNILFEKQGEMLYEKHNDFS